MEKSPDAFRTISEVADWLGVQAHVLRFWESKFSQVKPVKRAGGRRYYRPSDMLLLGGIKKLLHDDGLTIKGVQKILREQGVKHVSSQSKSLDALTGEAAAAEAARDVTPPEPDEAEATVLQFRGARGRAAPTPEPETEPEEAEAEEIPAETAPEPAAEPAAETMDAPPKPVLPSFLHRPAGAAAPPADEPGPPDAPPPTAPPPAPAVVEAPDPPPEDQIMVSPGVLARLAKVDRLTEEQARQIAPIAAELRAFVERVGG